MRSGWLGWVGNFLGMVFRPRKVGADFTLGGLMVWVLIEIKVGLGLTGGGFQITVCATRTKKPLFGELLLILLAPGVELMANYLIFIIFGNGLSSLSLKVP